jgi:hypothetical protein
MVEIDEGSKEVPSGIQHLKSLKVLNVYEMQGEFVLCMQLEGGKDYLKVKKVAT